MVRIPHLHPHLLAPHSLPCSILPALLPPYLLDIRPQLPLCLRLALHSLIRPPSSFVICLATFNLSQPCVPNLHLGPAAVVR